MKKKMVGIVLAATLVFGIGNIAFAHGNNNLEGWSFEEMLPFMKEMHPNVQDEQLEQMYQNCHGNWQQSPMQDAGAF
ncbi:MULTISPECIES: CUE domain-containing protein [unclassified Virgibacillus]|uniref:CUE domain-containing protein n=1 Tax=unclassified Virgibacillus TaxID=2620237 RepID=UPI0024DE2724|nr:CUE domain-containing protein [Virgibacillus sp. LDC-1]